VIQKWSAIFNHLEQDTLNGLLSQRRIDVQLADEQFFLTNLKIRRLTLAPQTTRWPGGAVLYPCFESTDPKAGGETPKLRVGPTSRSPVRRWPPAICSFVIEARPRLAKNARREYHASALPDSFTRTRCKKTETEAHRPHLSAMRHRGDGEQSVYGLASKQDPAIPLWRSVHILNGRQPNG
jgi:hypothetical protein